MFERIYDLENLYAAYMSVRKVSAWKQATQTYDRDVMPNLIKLSHSLRDGKYIPTEPHRFITYERGKPRCIASRSVDDRIVQRVVHDQILMPCMMPYIIYDNAASLEHRGTDFFRRRLLVHLSEFAAEHGINGYVLLLDFSKFFDNIRHDRLIEAFSRIIPEQASMDFVTMLVFDNKIDVSYMSDEQYAHCMDTMFNSIDYYLALSKGTIKATGEKFMYKSMDIGSQISQDAGIFYPTRIDTYFTTVKRTRYGRYMDDAIAIHESKQYLQDILGEVTEECIRLGLFINPKKTQIVSLKHPFSILKTQYKLYDDGSIATIMNNEAFTRERRKLNRQAIEIENGISKLNYEDMYQQYIGWRGTILKNTNGKVVPNLQNTDDLYNHLVIDSMLNHE